MKCDHWTQDNSKYNRQSHLCEFYGRHTGLCLRQEQDEEFIKCETKGVEGGEMNEA